MGFGFHSLAGYADSSIWAWGYNQQGQLGDNTKTYQSSPIAVAGGRSFDAIATGDYNSLTLDISDGLIYAWGYNDRGQLGDNTILPKSSPVAVAGSRSFSEIGVGRYHSLAIDASTGLVYAWGRNNYGQLGDNTTADKSSPIAVAGSRSFDEIAAGQYHSLALDASDGLVYAWGYNSNGELGDNTTDRKSSPVAVAGSRSFEFLNEMPPPPPPTPASTNLVCRLSVYFIPNSTNLVCRITNPASFPTIWGENNPTGGEINAGNWYKWSDGSGEKPDVT